MSKQEKVFDFDGYGRMTEIKRIQITGKIKFGGVPISSTSLLDCERPGSRYSILILEVRTEEPLALIFHKYDSGRRDSGPSLEEICKDMQFEFNPIADLVRRAGMSLDTCCLLAIALALRKARLMTGSMERSYPVELLEDFPEII